MCERERESERQRKKENERERENGRKIKEIKRNWKIRRQTPKER